MSREAKSLCDIMPLGQMLIVRGEDKVKDLGIIAPDVNNKLLNFKNFVVIAYGDNTSGYELNDIVLLKEGSIIEKIELEDRTIARTLGMLASSVIGLPSNETVVEDGIKYHIDYGYFMIDNFNINGVFYRKTKIFTLKEVKEVILKYRKEGTSLNFKETIENALGVDKIYLAISDIEEIKKACFNEYGMSVLKNSINYTVDDFCQLLLNMINNSKNLK